MTRTGRLGRWWRQRREQARRDGIPQTTVPDSTVAALLRAGDEPAPWSPGMVMAGAYEVGARCGAGRTGVVDRVCHLVWGLDLVVKSPHPQVAATREGMREFLNEALTWLNLPLHPQLCACHFVQVLDGAPRVFAEYAAGGSVADDLPAGQCATAAEILDVAIQMAWGLQAIHAAGSAHRDVRLTKVVRTADGVVKLLPGRAVADRAGAEGRADDVRSWAACVLDMFAGRVSGAVGPEIGKALAAYTWQPPPGRPALPESVAALLRDCLADRPDGMRRVADRLIAAFSAELGRQYERSASEAAELGADSLNNRALSMLALGQSEEAERYWEHALRTDLRHPDTIYNRGLLRWRAGRITDVVLLDQLEAAGAAYPGATARGRLLLGRVHLERGDGIAAAEALAEAAQSAPADPEIATALETATGLRTTRTADSHTLTGHTEKVWSVAITADGGHALSGSFDGTVRWWDLRTGRCLLLLTANDAVTSVTLTPDGRQAMICDAAGVAYRWEPDSGRSLGTLDGRFVSAALTPDGRHALTGSQDGMVHLWDLREARWLCALAGHEDLVSSVALTTDARLGVSCDPPVTKLWDLVNGSNLATITGDVKSMALSPDGRYLLTGHQEGEVRLWDIASGPSGPSGCLQDLSGHIGPVHSVAITADSRYAVSGGRDGTVRWWDLTSGCCVRTIAEASNAVVSVAVTPDGRHAVSGGYDRTVRTSTVSGRTVAPWSYSRPHTAADATAQATDLRARLEQARRSLDHHDVAGAVSELRRARAVPGLARHPDLVELWRQVGREGRRTTFEDARERGVLTGHTRTVGSVAITSDGRRALSGSGDRTLRWWDLDTGTCLRTLTGHTGHVTSVVLSPDGRRALSGSGDRTLRWWNLDTGTCLRTLTGHTHRVGRIAIAQDGRHALSASYDGSLRWWDLNTGTCLRTLTGHTKGAWSVDVSPDGRHAVSGGFDKKMRWWDLSSGACLATYSAHTDTVFAVAFMPDGRHAVSAGEGTIRLWDLETAECLRTLTGHTDTIMTAALTPDGRHVLSGSKDGTVRLWDLDTERCLRTLIGHTALVFSTAMTPNASHAISGGQDATIRLWELDWDYVFPTESSQEVPGRDGNNNGVTSDQGDAPDD